MKNRDKSIKKNYIYNLIYQLSVIIIPIITTPYISRVLNADGVGIYSYTISIVTYFTLFATLGVAVYGQLDIAACRDDIKKRSIAFWEIIISRTITSIIVIIIYFVFIIFNNKYKTMYIILTLNILTAMIDVSWYFQGIEKFKITITKSMLVKIIGTILIFIFVKQSNDLYKYALILQGTLFLGNLTLLPYLKKEIQKVHLKDLKLAGQWKKSLVFFIPTIATLIYTVLDKSMIGWITKSEFQNGYYEQAYKIEHTLLTIITSLGIVTMPRIKYLLNNKKSEEAHLIIDNAMNFVIFLAVPMTFGLFIISDYLVPVFLGEKFLECIPILKTFSLLMIIIGLDNTIGKQCLMAAGKQKQFNIGIVCGSITNFIMNLILIRRFQAMGAAIASVLAELVIVSIFMFYSKDLLNIKKMLKNILKYAVYSLIMSIIGILISKIIGGSDIKRMIVIVTASVITYGTILLITKDEMVNKSIELVKNKFQRK